MRTYSKNSSVFSALSLSFILPSPHRFRIERTVNALRKQKEALESKVEAAESSKENLDAQLPVLNKEMESLNEQLSINKEILETLKRQASIALEESDKLEEAIYEMQTKQEREENEWNRTLGKYENEIEKLKDHREFRCISTLFPPFIPVLFTRSGSILEAKKYFFKEDDSPTVDWGPASIAKIREEIEGWENAKEEDIAKESRKHEKVVRRIREEIKECEKLLASFNEGYLFVISLLLRMWK